MFKYAPADDEEFDEDEPLTEDEEIILQYLQEHPHPTPTA